MSTASEDSAVPPSGGENPKAKEATNGLSAGKEGKGFNFYRLAVSTEILLTFIWSLHAVLPKSLVLRVIW